MRFSAPLNFWLLLLVPLLGGFLAWGILARRRALARFARWEMVERLLHNVGPLRPYVRAALSLSGVFFLILALTGPQFGAKLSMARRRGVDVMVALDVSRSMLARDVKPSRLERAKHQIGELLDRLGGDRVGLVVFAGQAFVQCPLTLDYGAVRMFLEVVKAGDVPVRGTAIGDAVRVAARCFDEKDPRHKVIVLFTDGEDHAGRPVEAARAAYGKGVRLFVVGLGTPEGELIPERDEAGGVRFHKDRRGRYVKTRLDEATLEKMALAADGAYFRSTLSGEELDEICRRISRMERKDLGSVRYTQYEERFQIPLFVAMVCFFAEAFMGDGRQREEAWRGRFA